MGYGIKYPISVSVYDRSSERPFKRPGVSPQVDHRKSSLARYMMASDDYTKYKGIEEQLEKHYLTRIS